MTTIKKIAQECKVSAATVSNVLNGKGGASEETARKIWEVAKKLHYTPNLLAKNLKKQRTNTVGIITEDLTVFNTPEIVDGIDAYCEEHGYEIILGNLRLFKRYNNDFTDTEKHHAILHAMLENMLSKQVEGIVYVGYHCREISYLPENFTIPLVYAYCYPAENRYSSVIFDDEKAAYGVTETLLQHGHKKIGALCGPWSSFHTQERLKGFQQALYDHNVLYNSRAVQFGDWEYESGYTLSEALLKEEVTAIFCFNDKMAAGLYDYCAKEGIQIGKDLAVFGFDNQDISLNFHPKLSTVEPPLSSIGRASAKLVLDTVHTPQPAQQLRLPCRLIQRESIFARN